MRVKLQGVRDGTLYASAYDRILREIEPGRLRPVGRLPVPDDASLDHRLRTSRRLKPLVERGVGRFPTVNVWPLPDDVLLATAGRYLFRSADGGRSWRRVHLLPPSSGPMGVLPTGVCYDEARDAVYLGEYVLDDDATPRVLVSRDRGRTWQTALALPEVRHVHAVQVDPHTGDVWVTTGDTDAESRIGRLRDDGTLDVVGSGSQRWRAVELAFTPDAILWGMDCVYAESNPLLRLDRDALNDGQPTPETVHEVANSVYYAATIDLGDVQWVAFSTAIGAGRDSTAPDESSSVSGPAQVLAASSASEFTDWFELGAYRRASAPADHLDRVPSANAYVFLAADSDRGLFVNPYNTRTADGTIRNVTREAFENA